MAAEIAASADGGTPEASAPAEAEAVKKPARRRTRKAQPVATD